MSPFSLFWITMDFPRRLAVLRKQKDLTQQALADQIGVHLSQLKRYEAGTSQPTLEVIRKLAIALSVSADMLLFEDTERGPDEDFKLQFEAASRLDPEEKVILKALIDGMLLKHEAKRFTQVASSITKRGLPAKGKVTKETTARRRAA